MAYNIYFRKFQSSMMVARFCVGSGLFSIPAAFRYSGILVRRTDFYSLAVESKIFLAKREFNGTIHV